VSKQDGALRNKSAQQVQIQIRKLPIPNVMCGNQEGHLYRVSTEAILDRFSNTAAVGGTSFKVVFNPETNVMRSTNGLRAHQPPTE